MDVSSISFDVPVRLAFKFWTFWANFADVNTPVLAFSQTLLIGGLYTYEAVLNVYARTIIEPNRSHRCHNDTFTSIDKIKATMK